MHHQELEKENGAAQLEYDPDQEATVTFAPGRRFADALQFAVETHATQLRKGSDIPYIGHLLGVASLVIEEGGSEDQAIAALLHDAVEDQGGLAMLETLRLRFGDGVAEIVWGCTDAVVIPKPPWRQRKEEYLTKLPGEPDQVLLVSLADKVFNARAILADYQRVGADVWNRFSADKSEVLWYYRALADVYLAAGPRTSRVLASELDRAVRELEATL